MSTVFYNRLRNWFNRPAPDPAIAIEAKRVADEAARVAREQASLDEYYRLNYYSMRDFLEQRDVPAYLYVRRPEPTFEQWATLSWEAKVRQDGAVLFA